MVHSKEIFFSVSNFYMLIDYLISNKPTVKICRQFFTVIEYFFTQLSNIHFKANIDQNGNENV